MRKGARRSKGSCSSGMFLNPSTRPRWAPQHRLRHAAPLLDGFVIGPVPSLGDRGQSPLLARRLEAKPPVRELGGHGRARQSFSSPLEAAPPFGGVQSLFLLHSAL